jgi:hypothetical protein
MAKMIADGFEREPLSKQMAGTGMAQCVGTAMGCLDTQGVKAAARHMIARLSQLTDVFSYFSYIFQGLLQPSH